MPEDNRGYLYWYPNIDWRIIILELWDGWTLEQIVRALDEYNLDRSKRKVEETIDTSNN